MAARTCTGLGLGLGLGIGIGLGLGLGVAAWDDDVAMGVGMGRPRAQVGPLTHDEAAVAQRVRTAYVLRRAAGRFGAVVAAFAPGVWFGPGAMLSNGDGQVRLTTGWRSG